MRRRGIAVLCMAAVLLLVNGCGAGAPAADTLMTTLTFGYTPDENGVHTLTPDATFNSTVKGDISGSESVDMIVAGGKLAVTGIIDVHSLETAADTVLSLTMTDAAKTGAVVLADTINIDGTLAYSFDPLLNGLNTGDVLTVLNAENSLTLAQTSEDISLDSIFDYYTFNSY